MLYIYYTYSHLQTACQQADPTKLRELLNILKLAPQEQRNVQLAPLLPAKMRHIEKPKTKLVVKSRGDYPLKGFPSSLETFQAVGISLNRIDLRLLQLKNLRVLELSNNSIKSIPDGMKDVSLLELKLSGNKIADFPEVICDGELSKNLKLLDLARNSLTHLPHKFPNFKLLVQLRLDCNELQTLPRTFGKLTSLKFFSASNNKLVVLPPTFPKLSFDSLDLFGNPFTASGLVRRCSDLSLPSLQELAGRTIKKNRFVLIHTFIVIHNRFGFYRNMYMYIIHYFLFLLGYIMIHTPCQSCSVTISIPLKSVFVGQLAFNRTFIT